MGVRLSLRLQTIAELVQKGSALADVGSDHALLPIYLVSEGYIDRAVAIDNKKGPFEGMVKAIKEAGLSQKIEPLLSNGIIDLPGDIDTLVIAGMGGNLIIDILNAGKDKLVNVQRLIIDSHTDTPLVRKTLYELGYSIVDERVINDKGIYYFIDSYFKKRETIDELGLLFGPLNIKAKAKVFLSYLDELKRRTELILSSRCLSMDRQKECQQILKNIQIVYKESK